MVDLIFYFACNHDGSVCCEKLCVAKLQLFLHIYKKKIILCQNERFLEKIDNMEQECPNKVGRIEEYLLAEVAARSEQTGGEIEIRETGHRRA